jgi:hypothetical protein
MLQEFSPANCTGNQETWANAVVEPAANVRQALRSMGQRLDSVRPWVYDFASI